MKLAALTIASFLLSPSFGPHYAGWPPERFRIDGRYDVTVLRFNDLQQLCSEWLGRPPAPGMEYYGCRNGDRIAVFVPARGDGETFARVFTHEAAHFKGWTGMHEL